MPNEYTHTHTHTHTLSQVKFHVIMKRSFLIFEISKCTIYLSGRTSQFNNYLDSITQTI